jgi:hypothetical protein
VTRGGERQIASGTNLTFDDVFVVSRFQPIAPDNLHGALLAAVCHKLTKQSRRVIVAFSRELVDLAVYQRHASIG